MKTDKTPTVDCCPGYYVKGGKFKTCKDDLDAPVEGLFALPPDQQPQRVVTMVHGTFAQHAPWTRNGPLFDALKNGPKKALGGVTDELSEELKQVVHSVVQEDDRPPATYITQFCWSGSNNHTARLQAGKDLTSFLQHLINKFPTAEHYVIAHSHGGNVAMYAMKENITVNGEIQQLQDRVSGVITLATPFIVLRKRLLPAFVLRSAWFAVFFVLVLFCISQTKGYEAYEEEKRAKSANSNDDSNADVPAAADIPDATDDSAAKQGPTGWKFIFTVIKYPFTFAGGLLRWLAVGLAILPLMVLLWLGLTLVSVTKSIRGGQLALRAPYELLWARTEKVKVQMPNADPQQESFRTKYKDPDNADKLNELLKPMQPAATVSHKLLVMRALGDEATMSLVVAQFFSWVQNRILGLLQAIRDGFWGGGAGCFFSFLKVIVVLVIGVWLANEAPVTDYVVNFAYETAFGPMGEELSAPEFAFMIVASLALGVLGLFAIFGIVSVFALIGLLLAAWPLGTDAMFWNHFASTTSESAPCGVDPALIFHDNSEAGVGLAHSGIYTSKTAIAQICKWLKERRENSTPA